MINRIARVLEEVTNRVSRFINKGGCSMPCGETKKGTFDFIKLGSKMSDKQEKVREGVKALDKVLDGLADGAEKNVAKAKLVELWSTAYRSIRTEQIGRNARRR